MSWSTPAWPVGAFAFSSGLEWANSAGWLHNHDTVQDWIRGSLHEGALACDAAIFARAWRGVQIASDEARLELEILAGVVRSAQTSAERELEANAQGNAFRRIALAANEAATPAATERYREALSTVSDDGLPYALAAGALFGCFEIPLEFALLAFLHSAVSNLTSAAQRLVPLGHTSAQQLIAGLAADVESATGRAIVFQDRPIEELLASASPAADIACMKHETQYTRLFRT